MQLVIENYVLHAVRGMKNVARDLAGHPPEDSHTIPEQVELIVTETLRALEGIVKPESEIADKVRAACIEVPIIACHAMHAAILGGNASGASPDCLPVEVAYQWPQKALLMTSSCYFLREQVVPAIARMMNEALGGNVEASKIVQVLYCIQREESMAIERFAHIVSISLTSRIVRGVVCGGAMVGRVAEPRDYCIQLMSELSEHASAIYATNAPPHVATQILSILIDTIASVFRLCVREMESMSSQSAEQILLEIELVERLVGVGSKRESKNPFSSIKKYVREVVGKKEFNAVNHSKILENSVRNSLFFASCFAE